MGSSHTLPSVFADFLNPESKREKTQTTCAFLTHAKGRVSYYRMGSYHTLPVTLLTCLTLAVIKKTQTASVAATGRVSWRERRLCLWYEEEREGSETNVTDGGHRTKNHFDCQIFQQVFTGVPAHINHIFLSSPQNLKQVFMEENWSPRHAKEWTGKPSNLEIHIF